MSDETEASEPTVKLTGLNGLNLKITRCECGEPTCQKRATTLPMGCRCLNGMAGPYLMEIDAVLGAVITWCALCRKLGPVFPLDMEDRVEPRSKLSASTLKAMMNAQDEIREAHKGVQAWPAATEGDA